MNTKRITTRFNLSDVEKEYERLHTSIDDLGEQIIATETAELVANIASYGAEAIIGSAVLAELVAPTLILYTARGILNDYFNDLEAEKYAEMLKALAVAGPSGYVDAKLKINYETIYVPYEGPKTKLDTVKVESWKCYSDGSVIA
ncbi:hypothetical protein [Anaeromicrobium sediminis]|uniref:Uncharacterized protein n=1 Tax=Anaeromicrobium sediminis TaxID=1478221 RepID=A0A267MNY2_9FIRM|nr:hypothetical protein [Anaeromicrobium sediminis]PAB61304.1 hypothetical protein CCE28_02410 [Anaeromicrobium sediminis]